MPNLYVEVLEPTSGEPTQSSHPKKGEPVQIPVPSEAQIERDFLKVALASVKDEAETDE